MLAFAENIISRPREGAQAQTLLVVLHAETGHNTVYAQRDIRLFAIRFMVLADNSLLEPYDRYEFDNQNHFVKLGADTKARQRERRLFIADRMRAILGE